jgi:hypothetical protein
MRGLARIALLASSAAFLALVLLVARRAAPMFPVADEAVTELATLNALHGRQLLGPYSRYPWHHPGPAIFYLLAPLYEASGKRATGLAAAALTMGIVGLGLAAWVAFRKGGAALAVAMTFAATILLARVPGVTVSPWNPHVAAVLAFPMLILAGAAAAGWPLALPLLAGVASIVLQTHIAVMPLVGIALAVGVIGLARSDAHRRRTLTQTAVVLVVIWLVPVVEQFLPGGGNIGRLVQFALTPQPSVDFAIAIQSWADAVMSIVRPDFHVPLGLLAPHDPVQSTVVAAFAELLLLAAVAVWARANGRSLHMWIALELLAATAVSLWAVWRIPDGIHDHEVFWIALIGALNGGAILACPFALASLDRWRAAASIVVTGFLLFIAAAGVNELGLMAARSHSPSANDRLIRNLTTAVDTEITRTGSRRTTVLIDQRVWPAAAGVILQLQKAGRVLAVEPDLAHMFSGTLAADGSEDFEVSFCGGPCHERQAARPGNVVIWLGEGIAVDAIRAGEAGGAGGAGR